MANNEDQPTREREDVDQLSDEQFFRSMIHMLNDPEIARWTLVDFEVGGDNIGYE